jgi:hypothetical protein
LPDFIGSHGRIRTSNRPITSRFRDPGTAPLAPDRTLLKSPVIAKAGAADF